MTDTNTGNKLPSRSWRDDVIAEFNRLRNNLTRENIISNLKTLAWVIPLTVLIWIWAEREQVQRADDVVVPFELSSVDSNRVVRSRSQDNNLVLDLSGPQARLQELRNKLSGGNMPRGLKLEVPTSYAVNQDHSLRTMELINSQSIFADYGVTVVTVQPLVISVTVDELVEREAKIAVPPTLGNVEATFDPPTVKVRGPLNLLNRAAQAHRGQLTVYAVADAWPRTPGSHRVESVVLTAPEEMKDDRVRINDASAKVSAGLDVRQADKTYTFNSLGVTVDAPVGVSSKYDVEIPRPAVPNVTVTGPPEVIDAIANSTLEPKPKARLVITSADLAPGGQLKTKTVEYDLPEGVEVSPDDKKKTVEFRVIDRSTTPAP